MLHKILIHAGFTTSIRINKRVYFDIIKVKDWSISTPKKKIIKKFSVLIYRLSSAQAN